LKNWWLAEAILVIRKDPILSHLNFMGVLVWPLISTGSKRKRADNEVHASAVQRPLNADRLSTVCGNDEWSGDPVNGAIYRPKLTDTWLQIRESDLLLAYHAGNEGLCPYSRFPEILTGHIILLIVRLNITKSS
jgi:hypothetical protein